MSESESSSQASASHSVYERCDAAYLRELHQASGMDETQLARIACLSVAQVRQLIAGGDSLFYSQAVKRQAYKRLLLILGAPPPSQLETAAEARPDGPPPAKTIDDIVALSERNQYLEHRPVLDFLRDLRLRIVQWRQPLAALVLLLIASVLLMANWPSRDASSEVALAVPAGTQANALKSAPTNAPSISTAPTAPAPAPVAEPAADDKTAEKVADKTIDKPSDKPVAVATVDAKACAHRSDKLPEVTPTVATKEGRYVYLVSPADAVVCVVDANRQATLVNLRAGEGRSVYGASPWQVSGQDLSKVQIFFQGWRVALPDGVSQAVALTEKPR